MKIALAQTHIEWENKDLNLCNAENIIKNCSTEKVDLVLFPEMSFTGFSMNTDLTSEDSEYTIKQISKLAIENNIYIGFGWVEDVGEKCKNQYTIIDKSGKILSSYAKIHPFSYSGEDLKFVGGEDVSIFAIDNICFSNFICYDLRFPEIFRTVADKVHSVIISACWPAKRSEHWKTLLRARAIENQVYIFAINCVGDIGGLYYSGDSCVVNPNGEIVEMLSGKEGIVIYEFIDNVLDYRKQFPVLRDRKEDLYQSLMI
ncbi:MAG: hypothetical protein PUC37_05375 [Spirochaetales bacterium]|nr:hypothetical protein [Spirochaetales bacterium]